MYIRLNKRKCTRLRHVDFNNAIEEICAKSTWHGSFFWGKWPSVLLKKVSIWSREVCIPNFRCLSIFVWWGGGVQTNTKTHQPTSACRINGLTIKLQEKNAPYRTCARGKICYRSESYIRDDRGRRLRDWPAHPPSPLTFYVRFLRRTRIFHGRGEGGWGLYWVY